MSRQTEYLPFQDTTITARRSQADIIAMLQEIGCTKIGQIQEGAEYTIVAEFKGVTMKFDANIQTVQSIIFKKSRRCYDKNQVKEKAERIAWRLLHQQVKASIDLVKYDVAGLAACLGGRILLSDGRGNSKMAGDLMAELSASGSLNSTALFLADTRNGAK